MIPCQSVPADSARQNSTLNHPRIAHRLYSIITATYKHPEQSCIANKSYRLEQYTNSIKLRWKVCKTNLHLTTNTRKQRSQKSELKQRSYELNKISFSKTID